MANLTLRYLDELSYVLNSRKHLANQAKASSVGDLLNAEEERFTPCISNYHQLKTVDQLTFVTGFNILME
ncbi:unnamed protein product [Pieris brassicae]|uniref:Uncharacterized protein n=1 Tax=Pieris brassicae TaxID=7116 RepID=A0A9P0XDE0_PIEBR|nr:unnamed protein product [Pieris brassicae]